MREEQLCSTEAARLFSIFFVWFGLVFQIVLLVCLFDCLFVCFGVALCCCLCWSFFPVFVFCLGFGGFYWLFFILLLLLLLFWCWVFLFFALLPILFLNVQVKKCKVQKGQPCYPNLVFPYRVYLQGCIVQPVALRDALPMPWPSPVLAQGICLQSSRCKFGLVFWANQNYVVTKGSG